MGAIFGKNDYPIVLIHGFLGWGPDEMGGYKYWGGKDDIADLLRQEGHTVFEVSVGPVYNNLGIKPDRGWHTGSIKPALT